MKTNFKLALTASMALLCLYSCGLFKNNKKQKAEMVVKDTAVVSKDTAKISIVPKTPKKFEALITKKAVADIGMFNVYKQEDKYFLEIADTLLNKDILIVSRISRSAAQVRNPTYMIGYGGDQINKSVVRLDKGPNNKLFIRKITFTERGGDSTSTMYRSVENSNIQPIVASFEVKGISKNERGVIIDITDYLNGDNDILFFEGDVKRVLGLGGYQTDKSYVKEIKSYRGNVEIKTLKTYTRGAAEPGVPAGGFLTYELNSSMLLLPDKLMPSRNADSRIGYFSTGYTDFNSNPQGVEKVEMITRWRMKPRQQDIQKYLSGQLVEPEKQIVFYIDPATPKQWVPYLIQGINDWNVAFEQAGFKNAIVAKEAPSKEENPEWSLEDARYNAVVYKPSDIPNASGPHVNDPRTGEILETHVNWYHNVMKLLRNWYFIQASAVDPKARKVKFDEELMGQLIRFVSSHEIGHTLGLRHNYGSSSAVPVEKLRDKAWVEANGHTPSIMDYARFNYVAQPEDGISDKGIFPRIGDYDKWAIEWGYRWFPEKTANQEKEYLNKWIIEKTAANKRLWFGTETDKDDPRCQNEDLGDNAMIASSYGIKNLKRILPQILNWTKEENEGYQSAVEMYSELLNQFNRYMGHVAKNIGGVMTTPKSVEEPGKVIEFVSKEKQQEAVNFLNAQLFSTPTWLLNKEIFDKTGKGTATVLNALQDNTLKKLISAETINKLLQFEAYDSRNAYTGLELLNDVKRGIWSELYANKSISIYRRNLQKSYVERLGIIINPPPAPPMPPGFAAAGSVSTTNDMISIVKSHARALQKEIRNVIPIAKDEMTKSHLQDMDERINKFFKDTRI